MYHLIRDENYLVLREELYMFRHQKELQFEVKVDRLDPKLARAVQEVLRFHLLYLK